MQQKNNPPQPKKQEKKEPETKKQEPKKEQKSKKSVQFLDQFNEEDEMGEFKFADPVGEQNNKLAPEQFDQLPAEKPKFDDSTFLQRGPGKKRKGGGKGGFGGGNKGVHFDPYKLPDKVDFTKLF